MWDEMWDSEGRLTPNAVQLSEPTSTISDWWISDLSPGQPELAAQCGLGTPRARGGLESDLFYPIPYENPETLHVFHFEKATVHNDIA
jgi:hypothetical protein